MKMRRNGRDGDPRRRAKEKSKKKKQKVKEKKKNLWPPPFLSFPHFVVRFSFVFVFFCILERVVVVVFFFSFFGFGVVGPFSLFVVFLFLQILDTDP